MRRLLAIVVAAVLLLGAPAVAPAKGILGATVCGADGCKKVQPTEQGVLGGGAPADSPARPEPFVRIEVRVGVPDHSERVRLLFLPRSELLLGDDGGTWMVPMALAELQAIARRVTPYPASKLPAWAPLAKGAREAPPAGPAPAGGRASAATRTSAATPASAARPAQASASAPAAAAEGTSARDAVPSRSGDGFASWWPGVLGAVVVLAAGVALALRRRRRQPAAKAAGATGT